MGRERKAERLAGSILTDGDLRARLTNAFLNLNSRVPYCMCAPRACLWKAAALGAARRSREIDQHRQGFQQRCRCPSNSSLQIRYRDAERLVFLLWRSEPRQQRAHAASEFFFGAAICGGHRYR